MSLMTTNPTGAVGDAPADLDVDAQVGARVHQAMFLKRISQTKLAPQLGISQSLLSKKLRGSVPWSVSELIRVAAALEVNPADLLLRLDLNQQPFGYKDPQIRASQSFDADALSGLYLVPDLAPEQTARTDEYQTATRPLSHRTFVPVIVRTLTVSA